MQAVRDYLDRLLARPGMKVLICDKATLGTISAAESPSGLLQREVFLTELLANLAQRDQPMPHLKAVVWVRPTVENVTALCEELREPKYGEYHINFSNVLQEQEQELQALAEADEYDLVRSVTVHYADYVALSPELFTLNIVENGTAGNSLLDAHASLSGSPRSSEAGHFSFPQVLRLICVQSFSYHPAASHPPTFRLHVPIASLFTRFVARRRGAADGWISGCAAFAEKAALHPIQQEIARCC
eukprot:SAG31_NODE_1147_length_9665_cov_10.571399_7_plen_244_part_00